MSWLLIFQLIALVIIWALAIRSCFMAKDMNRMRKELKEKYLKEFQEKDEDYFLSLLKDTFEEIKVIEEGE